MTLNQNQKTLETKTIISKISRRSFVLALSFTFSAVLAYVLNSFFSQNTEVVFNCIKTSLFLYVALIAILLATILVLFNLQNIKYTLWIGLGFVLGGGLVNLVQRYWYGCVPDFINVLNFTRLNVSDVFIWLGIFVIVFGYTRK